MRTVILWGFLFVCLLYIIKIQNNVWWQLLNKYFLNEKQNQVRTVSEGPRALCKDCSSHSFTNVALCCSYKWITYSRDGHFIPQPPPSSRRWQAASAGRVQVLCLQNNLQDPGELAERPDFLLPSPPPSRKDDPTFETSRTPEAEAADQSQSPTGGCACAVLSCSLFWACVE